MGSPALQTLQGPILVRWACFQLRLSPFPHLVVDNALPDHLYAQLDAAYPLDADIIAADLTPRAAVRTPPLHPSSHPDK
jgi:hypothetical protein